MTQNTLDAYISIRCAVRIAVTYDKDHAINILSELMDDATILNLKHNLLFVSDEVFEKSIKKG